MRRSAACLPVTEYLLVVLKSKGGAFVALFVQVSKVCCRPCPGSVVLSFLASLGELFGRGTSSSKMLAEAGKKRASEACLRLTVAAFSWALFSSDGSFSTLNCFSGFVDVVFELLEHLCPIGSVVLSGALGDGLFGSV
ncbi:hypothetical protein BaRGS_00001030 [Batillaria attramentaria]|uniref:Secreted protein n=1 Tax=Batillaria attramentaria TaxID=370345 RepID=A0ABD0M953_9CAEN